MLNLGAHLSSQRPGYTHHGIYVGDGKVVHYAGLSDGFSKGGICETTLEEFSSNRTEVTVIMHLNPHKKFTPIEIVKRARDRIGENNYNVIFNNCEHFATWCATGAASSHQVQSKVEIACSGYSTYRAYQMYKASQAIRGPVMKAAVELVGNPSVQRTVAALSGNALNVGGSTVLKSFTTGASGTVITKVAGSGLTKGLTAATTGTAMTTAGLSGAAGSGAVVGLVGTSTVAAVAAPVALAAGGVALIGYGAYKLWDWLKD